MKPALALLPAAAVLAGLGLGWAVPGRPPPPLAVVRSAGAQPLQAVDRPDEAAAAALTDLAAALGADAKAETSANPDAAPPPRPEPPAPPPKPDVARVFRGQVSAVIDQGPVGLAVLLVDSSGEARQSRLLKIGDKFDQDWRLVALSPDQAVLQHGKQQRRVPLYGALEGAG